MGIGIGILLIAVGAVLAFAVHTTANTGGVDIHTVGLILLAVGAFGTLLSMIFWSSWGGPGYFRRGPYVGGPGPGAF
jgi:Domain of unknown function (DUF6458)